MGIVSNAVIHQSVVYYMYDGIYMATYYYMGEFDLGADPEFIDITDYFKYANDTIIDTDTDIADYLYVYRIIYKHNGLQFASDYLIGQVSEFENEEDVDPNSLTDDMLVVPTSLGSGSLYRTSRDGTMVMKGFPMIAVSTRYRGPIESYKINCSAYAKASAIDIIDEKIGVIDDYTTGSFSKLQENSTIIASEIRKTV